MVRRFVMAATIGALIGLCGPSFAQVGDIGQGTGLQAFDGPAIGSRPPPAAIGTGAGTYAHRFGRLHDLRRPETDPYPGVPQHRFGLPGSNGVPGHFVRPDRIGPYDRLDLPRRLGD